VATAAQINFEKIIFEMTNVNAPRRRRLLVIR
jgi:hypothetical protein